MRQHLMIGALLLIVATPVSLDAATLSGIYVISSQSDGHNTTSGQGSWDTLGGNGTWDIWVNGGGIGGPFLNGPGDSNVGLSIPMVPGSYDYTLQWAGGDIGVQYFAMNLFFDGNGTNPGISVYAPVSTVPGGNQPFFVNSTDTTATLYGGVTAASGTLSFVDGPTTVTLTDYKVFLPSVYNQDRISDFSATPDGLQNFEFLAQFSLQVTNVPEPSTLVLGGICILFSLGWWRGSRATVMLNAEV